MTDDSSATAPTPPVGPVDASLVPRYAGLSTFARLPRLEDVGRADVAVVGVPFDSSVSYRPGARFGPAHIRQSSRLLRPYNPALDVLPFHAQQVADAGDIAANPFDIQDAIGHIARAAGELTADGTKLLTLGGDHTIALPLLRAMHALHGPLAVLHFDAHLDTWDTYFGEPYTHGTPFRRASEEGLIDRDHSLHMGIRGPLYGPADLPESGDLGFATVHCAEMDEIGVSGAVERMLERLGDRPVYVSVDIDVLDPAHAPGTGTPEAGGLTLARAARHPARARGTHRRVGRHRRGRTGLRPRRDHRDRRRARRLRAAVGAGDAPTVKRSSRPLRLPRGTS